MAVDSLTFHIRLRWPWICAALYLVGLRNLAFRLCVKLDLEGTK